MQKRRENVGYFHYDGIKQLTAPEVESVCHFLPLNYLRIDAPEPALTSAPFISNSICSTIFSFLQISLSLSLSLLSLFSDLRTCFCVAHTHKCWLGVWVDFNKGRFTLEKDHQHQIFHTNKEPGAGSPIHSSLFGLFVKMAKKMLPPIPPAHTRTHKNEGNKTLEKQYENHSHTAFYFRLKIIRISLLSHVPNTGSLVRLTHV